MTEPREIALYVHWPFCQAKCPYCDFNSHVTATVDHGRWRAAFERELERVARELPDRILSSIFFGGGTPSLMEPDTAKTVIASTRRLWPSVNDLEVTLEANPTSSEAGKFERFRDAGVNRVSIGLQSLRDADLKALGRLHSAAEGIAAFRAARDVFDRTSFDLIYARQNQSLEDWNLELSEALDLEPDHLSLYQLTIEPGTAFGDRFDRGLLRGLPGDDLSADLFDLTQDMCEAAGLPAYETSNHARVGDESRHNLTYWRTGDWVGIGPGAHGRFTNENARIGTTSHRMPTIWLSNVESGTGEDAREEAPLADIQDEALLMGLRLREGVPTSRLSPKYLEKVNYINNLTEEPLLEVAQSNLRLTKHGRPLLNSVLRELLA